MKKIFAIILVINLSQTTFSQENIDDFLAAGIDDAKQFSSSYLYPATEGIAYGINNGWFNHGKTLEKMKFRIELIGNATFIKDDKKSFVFNISDYDNIRFPDDSPSKVVATALGHNDPDINVIVSYDDPIFGNQETEITLPTGIGSANISMIPTAFAQVSFSPLKSTEIKGRFFPKVNAKDTELLIYGLGVQHELTSWLPVHEEFPVSISGLFAYSHLDANYNFTNSNIVDGENQRIETAINTFLTQLIVSTRLDLINFYGGIGYLHAKSTTDLLGTYRVSNGVLFSEEIIDPFSVKARTSGIRANAGLKLALGLFGMHLDYSIAKFNSISTGISITL